MRVRHLVAAISVVMLNLPLSSFCQQASESKPVIIDRKTLPDDATTVDQFRDYLQLSGIGDQWRARWISAVDMNRSKGAPYWPESFWVDLKSEMRKTDLAPFVRAVYGDTFSTETMHQVNITLKEQGIQGLLSTALGQKFCADWATKEQSAQAAVLGLTQATIQHVYNEHRAEIQVARAKYIEEHPGYRDRQ
jgi:hypothetical protein